MLLCYTNFNSIKVRLIRKCNPISAPLLGFQFHKGSINTNIEVNSSPIAHRFQFHKGSINTSSRWSSYTVLSYFNSIKVRLIQAELAVANKIKANFNSIKVRLIRKTFNTELKFITISIP